MDYWNRLIALIVLLFCWSNSMHCHGHHGKFLEDRIRFCKRSLSRTALYLEHTSILNYPLSRITLYLEHTSFSYTYIVYTPIVYTPTLGLK